MAERLPVGVVVERRPARNRWQDHLWRTAAVLPGRRPTEPWSVLFHDEGVTRFFAGTVELVAYAGDTALYKHNLEGPNPAVYVVLRPRGGPYGPRLLLATVDPAEAHAHADAGDDLLDAVPMPEAVRVWLAGFVARHHVERTPWRRTRDAADPEILAPRRPAGRLHTREDGP
ncbi:DUF3305 domain-containing protein [Azospirillum halopraeferens]|uniref:DUF3305 domain-containing protein n=1 Tax=Azospirillum halopraeferens TaxID=34010 RepID=UPI000553B0D1|nr:DUF3305 domain-containing protein [Azospirillum halopraeferens]